VVAIGAAIASGCGSSGDDSSVAAKAGQLWGRGFVATAVEDNGASPPPIAEPADVRVSFSKATDRGIGWEANCNSFGATVRITASRLEVSQAAGTLMGCEPELQQEDSWLADFFEADPDWRAEGTDLTLTAGDRVMELEEAAD